MRPLLTLGAGVVVGGVLTAGLITLGLSLARGDSPSQALPAPTYVEESDRDGIDQIYEGEFQFFVGGGVAVFDCNSDLLPDLFFAGGSNPSALFVNASQPGGNLRFEPFAQGPTGMSDVTGAYPLDVDSDGAADLAVLRAGENVMLRGTGDCGFERANELWRIDGGDEWTTAFSATWEDDQSLPTLAFGNYLAGTTPDDRTRCADHSLIRPEGGSYTEPIALSPGWCTLSILFSDWSRNGMRDLRMTNDRHYYRDGQEQLWKLQPGQSPTLYGEDEGWQEMQIWGMGIASQDVTGDGMPEVFLTSQGDNKLQTLSDGADEPSFEDIALSVGATAHRPFAGDTNKPSTAWHAEFGDVNNDGFIDLFVTKGNVDAQVEFALRDPNNLLLGQPDGAFEESAEAAGIVDYARSRGGAVADLNLDGLLDVVVVERREPVRLWRNTGEGGHWLAVDIQQAGPNSDAIGAWVEMRIGDQTVTSEVTIGGGHAGGELAPLHFGAGSANSVDVRVIWPDGQAGAWMSSPTNRIVRIDRESQQIVDLWP